MSIFFASLAAVARIAVQPVLGTITHDTDTATEVSCSCTDPQLDLLRALMAQGFGQWEASLIAFGAASQNPLEHPHTIVWTARALIEIRQLANIARRALGLHEIPETATMAEVLR